MAGTLTRKDFVSNQEVRWCPGCGDYAILAQVQKVLPEFGVAREKVVFISGIGCSSRFPYYMNTYGFHTIHGRAPAIATGLKVTRPDLEVWVVTGDGDGLSIGGNHLVHALRRNIGLKILLFNNRIYGLTKGQYSPTSEVGKVTKSTPMGSVDFPFNPIAVALGAHASFVCRAVDVEQKHLGEMLRRAHEHRGGAFIEIFQNCNIFNDGAFHELTDKPLKADYQLILEHGKPLIFGRNRDKGVRLNGHKPEIVTLANGASEKDLLVHDETDPALGFILANFAPPMPTPIGVFYVDSRPPFEAEMNRQLERAKEQRGVGDLRKLLYGGDTWTVS
ncbi:MAG: 2-oxoacid:ferredoxin oxidoreductase subunit beta [Deltaproteobacteria bacterium]|jgi:2-oxoglutarate ferredoxin oxidoreductase subunit beta|nr:2-oxoacid:ferredoxin oxidoreductase subunit beta [Deltaproteobacteria bacterium]